MLRNRKPIKIFGVKDTNYSEKKLLNICNELLNDNYYIAERYPVYQSAHTGVSLWTCDPYKERSWRFWLHTLIVIEYLVHGFELFGHTKFIHKSLAIVTDWKTHNLPTADSEMAWHDHSTALRLIVICRLFEAWRTVSWDPTVAMQFAEIAEFHCMKLSDSGFYRQKHNHGLDQDIALYVAATVFSHLEHASAWRALALTRAQQQLKHLFAADGSYLEHSPGYSVIFLNRLYHFMRFLQQQGDPHYEMLQKIISRKIRFIAHILQPNGQIPPIGDSMMTELDVGPWLDLDDKNVSELKYVLSNGVNGSKPSALDALFSGGGYAALRNKWKFDDNTVQLVFYSGFHSRVHKHHDDLSFTLFGHGQPLLTDAGRYNYNYDSPERKYVVSARGHNTVMVDGTDTLTTRLNIGNSGLAHYYFGKPFSFVSGLHCLYRDVIHQRAILYYKPWNILVFDRLYSNRMHQYEQLFTFFPGVECTFSDGSILAMTSKNKQMIIRSLLNDSREPNLVKGQKNPLKGWCSVRHGTLEPAWTLAYTAEGQQVNFATHISLQPLTQPISAFQWTHESINFVIDGFKINLRLEPQGAVLGMNGNRIKLEMIKQPILEKTINDLRRRLNLG
ncbi:hypothetical protein CBW46_015450 [Paenibacillus xerothermodurans]|uniref:Uncharacterized protein n=2 Tax=Paenibacillus xerothermodurans TaxID=1977292 RepID=A0A2W1NM87_PAEXE|nr:hypothetical protein CBW46_015450 [Paenibacillus xerothermodurans]